MLIDSIGGDSTTEYGFYWGTTRACSEQIEVGNEPIEAGDKFDYELSGLSSDHKYYLGLTLLINMVNLMVR